jgi:hypothetical protein
MNLKRFWIHFAFIIAFSLGAAILSAQAQTANFYGSLSNFDAVNDTGHDTHGFEIQLEGLQPNDVYYMFSVLRYGQPTVIPTATGVKVRWASAYDASAQQFLQTTLQHPAGTPFAGTCYQWNGTPYATSGCEHFGVTLRANPTATSYHWLIEDPTAPGTLIAVNPPVALPAPTYVFAPPPAAGAPPVLVAEIEAPEPPETPERYGDAQWVKIFKTQLNRSVTLDELMSDNPIVPQDATQVEVAWDILQQSPPSGGNQTRNRNRNQGGLDPLTRSVIRRYETYQYTGAYDPVTHQVVCGGDGTCTTPQPGELGDMIGAQMAAANVEVNAVVVTKSGNGSISSSDKLVSCGNKCAAAYNAGSAVTLTANPASGTLFTGWTGACSGNQLTCTATVNGQTNVGANFASQYTLSIGRSGSGTVTGTPSGNDRALNCGGNCSAKFTDSTVVTLNATPAAGYHFVNWSGACSGTTPSCTVTITRDTSVQAVFSNR